MDQFPLEHIVEKVGSRFAVVVAAARRAQQIKDGSPHLVETSSRNPLTVALAEIAQGKVMVRSPEEPKEDITVGTLDQYFAGRDDSVDDVFAFRRTVTSDGDDSDMDALDDDFDIDLGDDDFDFDDDDEEAEEEAL